MRRRSRLVLLLGALLLTPFLPALGQEEDYGRGTWMDLRGGPSLFGSTGEAEADPGAPGTGAALCWRRSPRLALTAELYRTRFLIDVAGYQTTVNTVPLLLGGRWYPGSPGWGDPYLSVQLGTGFVLDVDDDPPGEQGITDPDIYGRGGPSFAAIGLGWESRRAGRRGVVGLELRHLYARLRFKTEGSESIRPDLVRTELVLSLGGRAGAASPRGPGRPAGAGALDGGGPAEGEADAAGDPARRPAALDQGAAPPRRRLLVPGQRPERRGPGRAGGGLRLGSDPRPGGRPAPGPRGPAGKRRGDRLHPPLGRRGRRGELPGPGTGGAGPDPRRGPGSVSGPYGGVGISFNQVGYDFAGAAGEDGSEDTDFSAGVVAAAGLRLGPAGGRFAAILEVRYRYQPLDVPAPAGDIDWDAGGWSLLAGVEWRLGRAAGAGER